jgi:hypothetical protein
MSLIELHAGHRIVEKINDSKPAFVHAVYFWLHDSVTDSEKMEFVKLLKTFKKIKSVKRVYVGSPAGTPRTVVDNSYDVALIVQFKDKAGHDLYQVDEIHINAIKAFEAWIKDIRIYDMIAE